jgi:NTE family protein
VIRQAPSPSFSLFAGVPPVELARVLGRLERRRYRAGAVVIAEGDRPRELYIVRAGTVEVLVADGRGGEVRVGELTRPAPLGEISLLTGQPATATVRAVTEPEVSVLGEDAMARLAERFPQVHRNLGALVAARLARTNRVAAGGRAGTVVLLEGASREDAHSLAERFAWHSRRPTLLVSLGDAFTRRVEHAAVQYVPLDEPPEALRRRVDDAFRKHAFVLVHGLEARPSLFEAAQVVRLDAAPALDSLARELAGLRVGVALGGGSIRGYAHLGVLNVLVRAGIPIDFLAGASVGAVVSGLYALGNDTAECAELLDLLGTAMVRPGLPHRAILSNRALRKLMRTRIPHERIEDLRVPLGIVTADIETHEEVVLRSGNLGLAMLAATAIPGIYPALRIGGHKVVDGGVLNPVPVSVVADMGADVVIAVRLGTVAPQSVVASAEEETGSVPSTIAVIRRAIDLMQTRIGVDAGNVPTVTITPDFPELPSGRLRNFSLGRRFIETGEAAAEAALPRIAALLPWLR